MDCCDATTDACCVVTAARSVPMGTDYVSTAACYATTLMADGVLAGASGVGKRTMGAPGEQKNLGRISDEIPTEKTPQWALTDSNRRPSACKADALNQLS